MRFLVPLLLAAIVLPPLSMAQKTFPQNGVFDERDGLFAFTNATIVKSWNEKIENATLLIRDGRIESVGTNIKIPVGAVVIDVKKKFIYPSFMDAFGNYGMPELPTATGQGGRGGRGAEQFISNKKGAYSWNEAFKTEFNAFEAFNPNEKDAEILRGTGFGTVVTHQQDGISRGSAAVVSLGNERANNVLLKNIAANVLSFSKGISTQMYPTSLMGCIALIRQTYLDGKWYAAGGSKEEKNISLEAWNALQNVPQMFDVGDKLEALRAAKIGVEFGKKFIIKGRGDDYQRLAEIKATGSPLILPLNFPEAFDVEDPLDALQVSLTDLKHWELAPTNPSRVAAAGIEFAFTTTGLKNKADFLKQLQKAMEAGLTEGDALKALTATPAKWFGLESDLGSLEKGKIANFFISDKSIFTKDAKILHNWVQGKPYVITDLDKSELKGTYNLSVGDQNYNLILGVKGENTISKTGDTTKAKVEFTNAKNTVSFMYSPFGEKGMVRLTGAIENGNMTGRGQLIDGTWVNWKAEFKAVATEEEKKTPPSVSAADKAVGDVIYPFIAFGKKELPKAEKTLFKNATVWTNEAEGNLENTDVLIEGGKILQMGKNIAASNAKTVDATGKYLTAGIIDEHSHITVARGVNEAAQSSTAEVRIADVINSDDINIYRQLAGGVTSSHILHGSANAIGGQTQLIKLRFGYEPEKMKFENWPGFIKFALGENVKRANGDAVSTRFPLTRMGVEQVFDDHFTRAKEYLAALKSGKLVRRDLELEALGEILEGKRHITCHSYVQSEINMLLKTADRHGFKVNTFTHILEGYKVADKMAKHGAAGAGFADWWNYKYEVYDAIPQNAKLMQDAGVLASINSDDAEMARRLNQEAAKSVMYASMDEVAAWKLVTLNPAKTLKVDSRVGSIKVGKDADLVLWSTNPLSIYAKAEQTYVDGVKFFDREEDVKMQDEVRKERARLIQKVLAAKKSGAPTQAVQRRGQRQYECEDDDDEMH